MLFARRSFFQIVSLMSRVYTIEYPPEYKLFLQNVFSWVGLNIITELECYQKISFLFKLQGAVFGPVGMVIVVFVFCYVSTFFTRRREKKKERMEMAVSLFIVITFAVLPSVSLVTLRSFVCDEETNTLKADPLIMCDSEDEQYTQISMVGTMGVIAWPVLVPLIYLGLLWAHYGPSRTEFIAMVKHIATGRSLVDSKNAADARRRGMSTEAAHEQIENESAQSHEDQIRFLNLEKTAPRYLDPLLEEFEPICWYVPVIDQLSKLAVTCGTIFRNSNVSEQLIIGILANILTMLIQFSLKPFKDFNDDLFSMFCNLCMFLVMLFSLVCSFQNKMAAEHAIIEEMGGVVADDLSGDMFEKETLGRMMVYTCASVVCMFWVFIVFEFKAAWKTIQGLMKWDIIKEDAVARGMSEKELLAALGVEGMSVVDKEKILVKYRQKVGLGVGPGAGLAVGAANAVDEEGIEMGQLDSGFRGGRDIRAKSDGASSLGGEVESSKERRERRAREELDKLRMERKEKEERDKLRMQQLKGGFSNDKNLVRGRGASKSKKEQVVEVEAVVEEDVEVEEEVEEEEEQFPPPPPLPKLDAQWDEMWDNEQNAPYYVHRESNESTWDKPPGI